MIAEAIEKIIDLARNERLELPDGRLYTSKGFSAVKLPEPKTIAVKTLTGIRDYLNEDIDDLFPKNRPIIAHVVNETSVSVMSAIIPPFEQRVVYMTAALRDDTPFKFGQWHDSERFVIAIQSKFLQDENTDAILRIAGNVQDRFVKTVSDDGVSQSVKAKSGITTVADVKVPNPVTLRPYRTFREVEQPASKLIFRMRTGDPLPEMALFDADGGAWCLDAMKNIAAWLHTNLPKEVMVIV